MHASIECRGVHAYLRANGTVLLNDVLAEEARLEDGDRLTFGDTELRVRVHTERADRAHEFRTLLGAPQTSGGVAASPWVRGMIGASATVLFMCLCLAGAYVAKTDPGGPTNQVELARTVARERQLHDLKLRAQRLAYETKVKGLKESLKTIESRIDSDRVAVERTVGKVERAVKAVESNVTNRVAHEVKRSLDPLREERKHGAAERLIAQLSGSVCMIQGSYGFGRVKDGKFRFLREASPAMLEGMDVEEDKVPLMLEGDGPIFRVEFTGTGFVAADGVVFTNRHIAQPWWRNDAAKPLTDDGFEPRFIALRAYFPGHRQPVNFERDRTMHAAKADLSALFFTPFEGQPAPIALATEKQLVAGRRVMLFGYPSGLDALLARSHDGFADQFSDEAISDPVKVLNALAQDNLIRPLPTQGFIGDVLGDKIVFDAATAVGGSGGPLVDLNGRVVAVNYGILKAFSSANFGVPVSYARTLLKRAQKGK